MRMMRVPRALFDWLDFRRSLAIIVVVLGGYVAWLYRLSHLLGPGHDDVMVSAAVAAAPLVGFLLAPALIGLVFGMSDFVDERVWTPWQGIHHAFDDHPIRVVEARGILWFCSADVHAALGRKHRAGVLRALRVLERHDDPEAGEMLSNAGLVRLLGKSTDRSTLRFLAWAERDVQRPWAKQCVASSAAPATPQPHVDAP